jgi:type II secretory pathway pseudopilin PulG
MIMRGRVLQRGQIPASGFTLVEVLIACLLSSVVLGLAMKGFSTSQSIADQTRSKSLAAQEAAQGVREVTDILRRSAIVFYSGQPLKGSATGALNPAPAPAIVAGPGGGGPYNYPLIPAGSGIPAVFSTAPYVGAAPQLRYNIGIPTAPWGPLPTLSRAAFRFQVPGGGGPFFRDSTVAANRIHSSDPSLVANNEQTFFSAPLAYAAEAIMNPAPAAGQDNVGSMPIGWNFYVIYLAPMDIQSASDPLLPVPGASLAGKRDLGTGPIPWLRSTIPLELRVLTIRNVSAVSPSIAGDPYFGRQRYTEPGTPLPYVPSVPWDFKPGQCNYDPIAFPNNAAAPGLITTAGFTPFGLGGVTTHDTERVMGGLPHTNFNSLGNDPPTDNVFLTFLPAPLGLPGGVNANSSDRVLARWIDPDSPGGTFVRFANPMATNTLTFSAGVPNVSVPGCTPVLPGNVRYVDTIEGGFQYNDNVPVAANALVSVTTRYRTGRNLGFFFSTKSEDVSLEASVNYQTGTVIRTRRN